MALTDGDSGRHFKRWWKSEEGDVHEEMIEVIDSLCERHTDRLRHSERCFGLMCGRTVGSLQPGSYEDAVGSDFTQSFNALHAANDALEAVITSAEPRPVFETDGADRGLQRKAEAQSEAVRAVFEANKTYQIAPMIHEDCRVTGTGFAIVFSKVDEEDLAEANAGKKGKELPRSRLCIERVYPWEILVDPVDAYYGNPRSLFRVRLWDRDKLIAKFPEHKQAILDAPSADSSLCPEQAEATLDSDPEHRVVDQVRVHEGWHLPSGKLSGDGLYVIAIVGADLHTEEWEDEEFPIVRVTWKDARVGYWGTGMVDEAGGLQYLLHESSDNINEAVGVGSMPIVAIRQGEEQQIASLSAKNVRVTTYKNTPPTKVTEPAVHSQVLQIQDQRKSDVFEQLGVNQIVGRGSLPSGVTSGKAMRDLRDTTNQRAVPKVKKYDQFFENLAEALVLEARRMERKNYRVVTEVIDAENRGSQPKEYVWSDLLPEGTKYRVSIAVASSTAKQVHGRNNDLEDLFNLQAISPEDFLQQYDSPDLVSFTTRQNAPLDLIHKQLAKIRETKEAVLPDPNQPRMDLVVREANLEYAMAANGDEPAEILMLLANYKKTAEKLLKEQQNQQLLEQAQAQAAVQAAAAPPPAAPAGAPQEPPLQ